VASAIRRERYGVSGEQLDDERAILTHVREVTRYLDFTWLRLPSDSPFHGRTLGELQIRSTTGASVVGVVHAGTLMANPDGRVRLEAETSSQFWAREIKSDDSKKRRNHANAFCTKPEGALAGQATGITASGANRSTSGRSLFNGSWKFPDAKPQ
jgi:hypothetical protein